MVELMDEARLRALAQRYGSFYLYDGEVIRQHTAQLATDFEGVQFLYSIKANHNPDVVRCVFSNDFGADAASLGEVQTALAHGLGREDIYYSAPGKTDWDIRESIRNATLIADSLSEVELINSIAGELGLTASIGVRLNPDFSFGGGSGQPSKFGIDTEQAMAAIPVWQSYPNINVAGIHVHLRSQELNMDTLAEYYRQMFHLAGIFQAALGRNLDFINMGSGMGIPYSRYDEPLDTASLGRRVKKIHRDFQEKFPETKILIEVGRYAVGKAGFYVTQVLDKKTSYGKTFVILANTLNGFLRPSLARLVNKYAQGEPAGSEPLFTGVDAFDFLTLRPAWEGMETVTLTGNLCTATDVIAEDVTLPVLERGDLVLVTNAGSYGAVLSPMQFSSQPRPAELFLHEDGRVYEAGTPLDM